MNARTIGSVFISYASHDREIVSAAARLLRAGGATVFQDVADIEFGTRWKEALNAALAQCERVMVFWSAAAAKSEWVEKEWRCALEAKKRIVPMMLDDTPLPPPLGEFHGVPDMIDMLRAAMPMPAYAEAPDGEMRRRQVTQPLPASAARGPLLAGLASIAILVVAAAVWTGVQFGSGSRADSSRGAPDDTVLGALDGLPILAWVGIGVLGVLMVVAAVWRARRARAHPTPRDEVSSPSAPAIPTADLQAIGRRFTSALFDQP